MLYPSFFLGTCLQISCCSSGVLQAKGGGDVMNWFLRRGSPVHGIPDSPPVQSQF